MEFFQLDQYVISKLDEATISENQRKDSQDYTVKVRESFRNLFDSGEIRDINDILIWKFNAVEHRPKLIKWYDNNIKNHPKKRNKIVTTNR